MSYRAPIADIALAMRTAGGLDEAISSGLYGDLDGDTVEAILDEAAKMADGVLAPLNRTGDVDGARYENGAVVTPPGWKDAYRAWREAGWNALTGPEAYGGQGLPLLLGAAVAEMWHSANMAFGLGPLLTAGAIEAVAAHGSQELKDAYLAKLVSGEWTGTMNLTEPQAGSDLSALRTRAERAPDGSYRITGQKIFITYGEHDLTENICHLVLARLPDAPPGVKGISLFLAPKFLPDADGKPTVRNDLRASAIEHKLGIHGSPTCTMIFGDNGGATGFLIGEENRGLNCMFTMMNNARLAVGLEGVGIAERAYQQALAYARERRQGRSVHASGSGMSPIIEHPDVQRMLMTMRGYTQAARAICYMTAAALDRAHRETSPEKRKAAADRGALLTPIAKAFSTDIGMEAASLGVQIHGGMGFIEETGAAQHYRDARIAMIYEGANGIHGIDLVMRKLPLAEGEAVKTVIREIRDAASEAAGRNAPPFGKIGERLSSAADSLDRATDFMLRNLKEHPQQALAGATPYLRLFGLTLGGAALVRSALAATDDDSGRARIATARFFAQSLLPLTGGLELDVVEGGGFTGDAAAALAG
ncbi:MAG: acyl-CoA dehydrogenase [Rhizobiales bacterium 65-9]|nr:acyl-CoA dehydrogenase [Hyphomicrobiales bacterium]OJY38055.1 MAG: acyl-CoA dehydrogenase [Rhizobiales bacterium 65-9]